MPDGAGTSFVRIAGFAILGSGWAEAKKPRLQRAYSAAAVVGTPVTFAVEPSDSEGEQQSLRYRFRVRAQGGNYQVTGFLICLRRIEKPDGTPNLRQTNQRGGFIAEANGASGQRETAQHCADSGR